MKKILGWALLAWVGVASAADKAPGAVRFETAVRLDIDDKGVPQQAQANEKLPAAVKQAIEQQAMQWRFEPAQINGVAASGVTYVSMAACAAQSPEGALSVSATYLSNGPGHVDGRARLPLLRYPPEAIKTRKQGEFTVLMQIGTNGRASIESIEVEKGALKWFEDSLAAWVASFRFLPEQVAGAAVATRVRVPVSFDLRIREESSALQQREKAERSAECVAAKQGDADPQQPVVLDSPFKPRAAG